MLGSELGKMFYILGFASLHILGLPSWVETIAARSEVLSTLPPDLGNIVPSEAFNLALWELETEIPTTFP